MEITQFFKKFEEEGKFSSEFIERIVYSHDLAPLPELVNLFFDTIPDAVVQPQTPEEVVEVINISRKEKIPITPRGAGTSGLGGAIPTRGGLVLETARLDKVVIDKERRAVIAESGAKWLSIIREAEKLDLTVPTYPSSAPSATVGGWVSVGGIGIGTLKYGGLENQLNFLEIVLPNGELVNLTKNTMPYSFDIFLGSEGTLGVVTKAEVMLVPKPELLESYFVCFDKIDGAMNTLRSLYSSKKVPYYVEMLSPEMVSAEKEIGHYTQCEGWCSLFVFEGDETSVKNETKEFEREVARFGGVNYGLELGEEAWRRRFKTLEIKSLGPTLLGNEAIIPLEAAKEFARKIGRLQEKFKVKISTLYVPVSSHECLVMPFILTDERRTLSYYIALALSVEIVQEAMRIGGKPYGYGLWNAPFARKTLSKDRVMKMLELKEKYDPEGLVNPGKLFEAKTKYGFKISAWQLSALALLGRIFSVFTRGE